MDIVPDEIKKAKALETHRVLLNLAIVLQIFHFPTFISFIFSPLLNLLPQSVMNEIVGGLFMLFFIPAVMLYLFHPIYWGMVLLEGLFLFIFLRKTGNVRETIHNTKKKYIFLAVFLLLNLFVGGYFYHTFWYYAIRINFS